MNGDVSLFVENDMKKLIPRDEGWVLNITLATVLLLTAVGCSRPWVSSLPFQKIERPADILEKKIGLIGDQKNIYPQLRNIEAYFPLVKVYARKYNIDWLLIVAMMKQESLFDEGAVSHRGASGLMQIMPLTQIELSEKLSLPEANSPRNNILAGIYYFQSLYADIRGTTELDRVKIALAAYNAGRARIADAQAIARYLGEDPQSWDAIAQALTLMSKQNYTLHRRIWNDTKPPSGYFRDWKQTQTYVENVIEIYNRYSLALR